jgi:hypothetical protein
MNQWIAKQVLDIGVFGSILPGAPRSFSVLEQGRRLAGRA